MAKRTKTNLKSFRSAVAALKKKGLIHGVDARSVKPTRSLRAKIDKFDDVLSGKVTPVKLSPKKIKEIRKSGAYEIAGRGKNARVLVPHSMNVKVGVSHDEIHILNPNGVSRKQIFVEYHNLKQYLRELKKNSKAIGDYQGKQQKLAFRFFGNYSHTYDEIDLMVDDLERYKTVIEAIQSRSSKQMMNVYANLEIVTSPARRWEELRQEHLTLKAKLYKPSKESKEKYQANLPEYKKQIQREKTKLRVRRYRERKKTK